MTSQEITMFQQTVQFIGKNIWIKPVCHFFSLNVQNQYRKLKNDTILRNLWTKKSADLGEIDNNGRILLSKKGFIRWIQTINVNTIRKELQEKFVLFQTLIFDFLYGSVESEEKTRFHYTRLQKLERLYGKIGAEIKREKTELALCLNSRYIQLKLNF